MQKQKKSTLVFLLNLFSIFFGLLSLDLHAENMAIFKPDISKHTQTMNVQLEYLVDQDGRYSIEQVANEYSSSFKPFNDAKNTGYEFKYQVLWIKFKADHSEFKNPYWFLTQKNEHVGTVSLYYPNESGSGYIKSVIDDHNPERSFSIHDSLFQIPTVSKPQTYYLRFEPDDHWLKIELSWSSIKGVIESIDHRQMVFGVFYGGLILMFFYNLFLYYLLRDKSYFYYVFYLFFLTVSFIYLNGYAPIFIKMDWIVERFISFCSYGTQLSIILFTQEFLNIPKSEKKLRRVLSVAIWFLTACVLIALFVPLGSAYQFATITLLLLIAILIWAGYVRARQGYYPARIYLLGWLFYLAAAAILALRTLGIFPSNDVTRYAVQVGAFLEAQIFAIALAYRVRIIGIEADKAKNSFLGMISHELKTPLQTIVTAVEYLSLTRKNKSEKEALNGLSNAVDHLVLQVKDLTEFAKLDAGKFSVHIEEFNATELLTQIAEGFREKAENKRLVFKTNIEGSTFNICSDRIRVAQIANNLIDNAIKFTEKGSVSVSLQYLNNQSLLITVEDTGIGIDSSNLTNIFLPFTQLDKSSTRKHDGFGMGLAIVKKLIDLLGGKIKVDSVVGKGTRFEVQIPVKIVLVLGNKNKDGDLVDTHKILFVEDNPEARNNLVRILELLNYSFDVAVNGKEAIQKAKDSKYGAIFLDYNLPDINGTSVAMEIRKNSKNLRTPIISASAEQSVENTTNELFDDFLEKPFTVAAVTSMLTKYVK